MQLMLKIAHVVWDRWTHNKTIQKAVESYRITPEQKDELRSLRWKDCAKEEGV